MICSSVEGHLGCFHEWAVVNRAAMNMGTHVCLSNSTWSPLGSCPGVTKWSHMVDLFLGFLGTVTLTSTVVVPVCTLSTSSWTFPLSHIHDNLCFLSFSHSDKGRVSKYLFFSFFWWLRVTNSFTKYSLAICVYSSELSLQLHRLFMSFDLLFVFVFLCDWTFEVFVFSRL